MLRRSLLMLTLCLPLAACQTMGGNGEDKFSTAFLNANLKKGVTTPEQVRSIYGTPDSESDHPDGPYMWTYTESSTSRYLSSALSAVGLGSASSAASAASKNPRRLSIFFSRSRFDSYILGTDNK